MLAESCDARADKNLGVFTGFLAGIAWKGTETFKQARPPAPLRIVAALKNLTAKPRLAATRFMFLAFVLRTGCTVECPG